MNLINPESLQQAYLDACEAELQAFKPGNVSIHSAGHGMSVEDFRQSAKASAPPLCDPALSLGEKILHAIAATRNAVGCNTNLGIVLLAAPLMEACLNVDGSGSVETCDSPHPGPLPEGEGVSCRFTSAALKRTKETPLRENLRHVLAHTTREDAAWVYRAIRLAAPGALGESAEEDVRSDPTVTLLEAMQIAEGRDRIAWQYTNNYRNVFDLAIPRYHRWLNLWGDEQWATLAVFTGLLLAFPDSHIERKFGDRCTRRVVNRMTLVEQAIAVSGRPEQAMRIIRKVDAEFKSAGINPGTTADLTVACLLAVRLDRLFEG